MSTTLTTEIIDSMDRIAADEWNRLADSDAFYLLHGWLRRLEEKAGWTVRYVLVRHRTDLVAALPVTDLAGPESGLAAELVAPTGISGRFLLAGAVRGHHNHLLLAPQLTGPDAATAVVATIRAAVDLAARNRADGVVFPSLTTGSLHRLATAVPIRAALTGIDAELVGLGGDLSTYIESLSGTRRRRVRRDLRLFAEAGWKVEEQRLSACWSELGALLYQVQQRYGHSPDIRRYQSLLRRQAELLDDLSVVFGIRDDDRRLVGAMLGYRWRDCLYARLVGFDYPSLRSAMEYFSIGYYRPIEYIGRTGMRRMHLGAGSYEAKVLRGAEIRPLWTAAVTDRPDPNPVLVNWPAARDEVFARFQAHSEALPPARWQTPHGFDGDRP